MKKLFLLSIVLFCSYLGFSQEKYSKIKIYTGTNGLKQLNSLGLQTDDGIHKAGNYFITDYSTSEINKVKTSGLRYEIIVPDVKKLYVDRNKGKENTKLRQDSKSTTPANFHLGASLGGYLNFEEIQAELDLMHTLYPNLITVKSSIGTETTTEGRTIYFVKISDNPNINEPTETQVLYNALTHAREPMGMMHIIYYMWYLLENYDSNLEVKAIVDNLELYFVPCINPDGYVYNQTTDPTGGGMQRKNRRPTSGGEPQGVDLNRNYGYQWGFDNTGSSNDPADETYRGTAGFSENETQMIKSFSESHNFVFAQNTHTYSNYLLFPWGYDELLTPDDNKLRTWGHYMASQNQFQVGTCWELLYTANGGADDWMYGEQTTKAKTYSYTPESGNQVDGFWPAIDRIEPIATGNLEMNLYFSRLALKYAKSFDASPEYVNTLEGNFDFNFQEIGNDNMGDFTVELVPLKNISSVGTPVTFTDPNLFEMYPGSISYVLDPTPVDDSIIYILKTSSSQFSTQDTIVKLLGNITSIYTNDCSNIADWTVATTWNTTTDSYHSATASITDSPAGNYGTNISNTITSTNPINLTSFSKIDLVFWAKWAIEADYDYCQLSISTNNGTSWTPLAGNYTNLGVNAQTGANNEPLYDGSQSNWIQEKISLDSYIGQNVKFRFQIFSDSGVELDGFYFDDFEIQAITPFIPTSVLNVIADETKIFPNPTTGIVNFSSGSLFGVNNIKIINSNGITVKQFNSISQNLKNINLSNLPKGLYIVKFEGNKNITTRIVIE